MNKIFILSFILIFFSVSLWILSCPYTEKENDQVNTFTQKEIQDKIDSANDGDTVLMPEGISTWTTKLDIPDNKELTIKGAGYNKTIITSNMPNEVFDLNSSGSRVTQIGFRLQNDNGYGISVRGDGWRIDHCSFMNSTANTIEGVIAVGYSYENHPVGVIDHCEFLDTRVLVYGDASLFAHKIWSEPLGLGTNNAMFVEDCTFTRTHGNAIDSNYGGKYVFRYNNVNDAYIEAHSVQGNHRAARSWEIYNNTINQINISMWVPVFLRGGTGVVFDNTFTGNWSADGFALDNVRSCNDLGDGGLADGTSLWDGTADGTGYPARDQIGRSTDQWEWTDIDPYPPQASDPAYCWNNKDGSDDYVFFRHGCTESQNHIQENRDFYNNVTKPGYTPFTYPHPIITEDNSNDS